MEGRDVMLVLFGHPKNTRGTGSFFTMLDPFSYLSVTQGLAKEPIAFSPGAKFQLTYLLTVYSENKPREVIQRRSELWAKERQ
jgi:hypothetical protein